jgi:hypothetical protein
VIIRSPHPPVPLSGLRLTEFILAHAAEGGRKAAIIDGTSGRVINYHDLAAAIYSAAAGLARHGVGMAMSSRWPVRTAPNLPLRSMPAY